MSAYYECECDNFDMTEGQDSFKMNEGIPGPGVPAGGSAGQVLRKTTSADYDTEWDTLDAGEIPYSGSSSYPNNTVGSKVYELDSGVNSLWNYAVQANTKASNALDNEATAYNYHLQYHVGDYCLYQQKLYRCIVETPAAGEMWNSSHWTEVTVGDEMSETASDISVLKNTLLINTRNLFDSNAIELQKNTVGDSASKRAISGRAFVGTGNKFTVKAHNLPSNLKYQIVSYTGTALSTFQSSYTSWITNTDATTITATKDYMAVLFGTVNDNDITKNDFSGLKLQVELGANSTEFVPFQVANDVIAREGVAQNSSEIEKTTSRINSFMTTTRNLFNPDEVLLGYIAPGNPNSIRAISGLIDIGTGNAFSVKATNLPANLKYETVPYQDETTSKDAYTSWVTDSTVLSRSASYRYVRILFGTVNGNDITKNDFIGLKIQVELGDVTAWVPYEVPCDAIVRELVGSGVEEIRLMEYNIGHYCYGTGTSYDDIGLPAESYDEKVAGMKAFLAKYRPDILGLCEYNNYLDRAKTQLSDDVLFDPIYPYKYESEHWNAIKSNYFLTETETGMLTAKSSTEFYKAVFNINGKQVAGMVVHFPIVDVTDEDREAEMTAAIAKMADYDTAFICGDFNTNSTSNRDTVFAIATEAGYTLANGDYFGWHMTYNYTTLISYLDNIIVKGNIKVKDFKVLTDEVGNLCSDHIPIYADLLIY